MYCHLPYINDERHYGLNILKREKGKDMTKSFDKCSSPQQTIQKSNEKTQKRHQKFDYKNDCGPA